MEMKAKGRNGVEEQSSPVSCVACRASASLVWMCERPRAKSGVRGQKPVVFTERVGGGKR